MSTKQLERNTGTGWTGRAWIAVALMPVFFFISLAVSYGLYDVLGYAPENNDAPLWVDLVVALVGLAVFLLPCTAAVAYGRRAVRRGDRGGLVPLGLGGAAGLGLTALTVVTTVADGLR